MTSVVGVVVPVHEEPGRTLHLKMALAHGTGPKGKLDVSLDVTGAALIVQYDGRQFYVNTMELVKAVASIVDDSTPKRSRRKKKGGA